MSESRARSWLARGGYFSWSPGGETPSVQVFHVEAGDPDAPPLLLVHGFPTSSIDWDEIIDRLSERFRVCALDFPGLRVLRQAGGLGLQPRPGRAAARPLPDRGRGHRAATVLAHDRGDSVALILAGGHAGEAPPSRSSACS